MPPLGGTRFQRAVIVVQDGKVTDIKVEPESGKCESPPRARNGREQSCSPLRPVVSL